jgi:hypothetical protein
MLQKLKKNTPEWMQVHLPPVIIAVVGIITGSIILTNQFIRQAENQFLSYIDILYQNKQVSLQGNLSLTTNPETITYPISTNLSFENTSFPIIDLPAASVSQTPFGSFEGVRIYPERTYGKLTEAQEYWITLETSDFIDYTYQRFLQTYIPDIFSAPHTDFWQNNLATSRKAQDFLKAHIDAKSLTISQEGENLILQINPKAFRDVSINYYESTSGQKMSVDERKWYEDTTNLIPSKILITPNGQITASIESQFFKDSQTVTAITLDVQAQSSVAVDYREPADRRRITEVPQEVQFTTPLKALASIEYQKLEKIAEKIPEDEKETEEVANEESEESNSSDQSEENSNSIPANLFETQRESFRSRKWYSN